MTLIEVTIALVVLVVGVLGLFRAVSSSMLSSTLANQVTQAQARAQQVLEAIRKAPARPTNVLNCLAGAATPVNWAACEAICKTDLGPTATNDACVFVTLANANQAVDRSNQQYAVSFDTTDPTKPSSFVVFPAPSCASSSAGLTCPLYDVQVVIGWNDDGTATPPFSHRVAVHQVVVQ